MHKNKLTDILDSRHLQRLQDAFSSVAKVTTVICDETGQPITTPSNVYGICQILHLSSNNEGCTVHSQALFDKCYRTKQTAVHSCPYSGLVSAAVPILLNDVFMGCWMISQIRVDDPSEEILSETAKSLHVDFEYLSQLIYELPKSSKDDFEQLFRFLLALNYTIIQLGDASSEMRARNTELEQVSSQVDNLAQMLRRFVDSADVGLYVSDMDTGEILMTNDFLNRAISKQEHDLIGRKCWEVASDNNTFCPQCPYEKLLDENGNPGPPQVLEYYNEKFQKWIRSTHQAIVWVNGSYAHMVTFLDVTAEHAMRQELSQLAFFDRQMDLPNGLKLVQDLAQVQQEKIESTFLIGFDIVALRRLNDVYGRETGDELLREVVKWIQKQEFAESFIYRIEGDEFCLLLHSTTTSGAHDIACKIHERFSAPWHLLIDEMPVPVLCNITIALINAKIIEGEDILNLLERTLDKARKENQLIVYDESMDKAIKRQILMELSLKNCVANNMEGFDVHYQPVVNPSAGTWQGMEALCRWTSPEIGSVPPLVFIQEAEALGLIGTIGLWVLETAIAQCKKWKLDEVNGFFLSVNLSPIQIMDDKLVDKIVALLEKYDYPGQNLDLEITESAELYFRNYTLNAIQSLRNHGVNIALDDFGTGYSSFNNLKNLPVSFLKTERAFIKDIEQDRFMQYLFYILVELAHATNMRFIAEGIETQQQLEIVLKNGADFVQGYYFSKPLPAEKLEKSLFNFHKVNAAFYALNQQPLEAEQLFNVRPSYFITPGLFKIINQCMQVFLAYTHLDSALDEVLTMVGNHFRVSRVYLCQLDYGTVYTNTHEWCAPGVSSQMERLTGLDMAIVSKNWIPSLEKDGMIVASDTSKLPKDIYELMIVQDVQAVAVLPIYEKDRLTGFIGLDACHFHEWLPEEVLMLRNLSVIMGSCLSKDKCQQQVLLEKTQLSQIVNATDVDMMVTDIESNVVLWANNTLLEKCKTQRDPVGENYTVAFPHFPVKEEGHKIEKNASPKTQLLSWKHLDVSTGKLYLVCNRLIVWEDSQVANLQYMTEIDSRQDLPTLSYT